MVSKEIQRRRERVFLILSGLFLGSLAMLNILGTSRFIDLSFTFLGAEIPVPLAIGVLPYPITFLCTDFICELYGERRANQVVWMGLLLNVWVLFIVWLGEPGIRIRTSGCLHGGTRARPWSYSGLHDRLYGCSIL